MDSEMWGGGIYRDNLIHALRENLSEVELKNEKLVKDLTKDIVRSYLDLKATPEEYFVFGFRTKNRGQRSLYLTNMEKDLILMEKISQEKILRLRDKEALFKLLPDFFKRDLCVVKEKADCSAYVEFVSKHERYFIKPLDGMCGRGAEIKSGDCFDELLGKGRWIVEELVIQVKEFSQFNPDSVNTVRLPTFWKDGEFIPLAPFLRTGRKGSIVDNGAAGGVFCAIDELTGQVITCGFDENNHQYEAHPDSGIRFKGYMIPRWEELLETARRAHERLSDQKYSAWDCALTARGWTLIEANSMGQFLWQYATKQGIRDRFLELMTP